MCGIIAIVRRPATRAVPTPDDLAGLLDAAVAAAAGLALDTLPAALDDLAVPVEALDAALRGTPGVRALLASPEVAERTAAVLDDLIARLDALEAALDAEGVAVADGAEAVNAAMVRARDATWAVRRDRLRTAAAVADLAGTDAGPAAIEALTSVQQALSALDRLEVRGRDSAGIHLLVRDHGLALDDPAIAALLVERAADGAFGSRAVRTPDGQLSFVYKAAAEIGELGDNTRALRFALRDDALLHLALRAPEAQAVVLGHTRWASVGIISEPNAHPVNSDELTTLSLPYVTAALNGDVDNYADLKSAGGIELAPEITTDAKIIPVLVGRHLAEGLEPTEAFRQTVAQLEGSVAIAASAVAASGDLLLALRGSGQALYIGLAEDACIVASEPYGIIEDTSTYLRLDGETPANPEHPIASRGQVVRLRGDGAGSVAGIERVAYDGTPLPVAADDLATATITTRDIDRGDFPHFLLKEIHEAPGSFRKTLRGRLVEGASGPEVHLGDDVLAPALRTALRDGAVREVIVIGQGTAAIAAQAAAAAIADAVEQVGIRVRSTTATELSGFGLRTDLADTLVVAISQSGTTTDTNRTVDLVRDRGGHVIAIVNRRGSDLTDKADGVLYTSDGRDVEMSVASTKAFYAQVAAGFLLAAALGAEVGVAPDPALLEALRELPVQMGEVIARRDRIAEAAHRLAPSRRYWAMVGNGWNSIAAQEIRIKLSELCYKSIACDITEDKKHIDLSSEPLIVVCAAGLTGSNADDVAKEIAIYRAHKAAPVVVATEGEERFNAALAAIAVPATDHRLAFILSTMAGHLFGYEAALAIDAQARPLREARAAIETAATEGLAGDELLTRLVDEGTEPARRFFDALRRGDLDGHLEASTAAQLAAHLRYGLGTIGLDSYQVEFGKVGTPGVVVDDLRASLTQAIEELTRPIDAIKHQAKTVTVGISRTDETLLQAPLVARLLTLGAPRDRLSYRSLRTMAALDPIVAEVTGHTRYAVAGDVATDATLTVIDRGGIAVDVPSRTERQPALRGTKHLVATEQSVFVAVGRSDGRTVIIVPEVKDGVTTGLTLLHVRFVDHAPVAAIRGALAGYRNRYSALMDAVTETEDAFREDMLETIPLAELFSQPVYELAERWRS